jgi:hypothetical protein
LLHRLWQEDTMAERNDSKGKDRYAAPAPKTEDQLSPGKVVRDLQRSSRSERLGDSTPTGPATSSPVDPDAV